MTLVPLTTQRGELRRARIRRTDTDEEFEVQFNPTSLSVLHAADWREFAGPSAADAPTSEYIRPRPRQLTLSLTLDGAEGDRDVVANIQRLASWLLPAERSLQEGHREPPVVEVDWNGPSRFACRVESVQAHYTLFRRDGTPVRAIATVTLKELPAPLPPTNPTSGGERGHRRHVVVMGESLHAIAQREYGDPRLWRAIAATNGIDDPLRLAPGTPLHLPPLDRAIQQA